MPWSVLQTLGNSPSERSSPATVAIDGHLWVFGGVFDDFDLGENQFYDDLHRLNLNTGTWVQLNTHVAPPARAFASATVDTTIKAGRGRMLLFGGSRYTADFGQVEMFDDLWAFDPMTEQWQPLQPNNSGPSARASASIWVYRDTLYVFGGIEATFTMHNDLWALDLDSLNWRKITTAQAPSPRRLAQISAVRRQGRLTLYGGEGFDVDALVPLNDTWELDLNRERWTQLNPDHATNITRGRNDSAAGSCGSSLFIVGGDLSGGHAGCGSPYEQNVTNEVWHFDRRRQHWREAKLEHPPLPALKRTGYATWQGHLYLISGWSFTCAHEQDVGQLWNTDVLVLDLNCRRPP